MEIANITISIFVTLLTVIISLCGGYLAALYVEYKKYKQLGVTLVLYNVYQLIALLAYSYLLALGNAAALQIVIRFQYLTSAVYVISLIYFFVKEKNQKRNVA